MHFCVLQMGANKFKISLLRFQIPVKVLVLRGTQLDLERMEEEGEGGSNIEDISSITAAPTHGSSLVTPILSPRTATPPT